MSSKSHNWEGSRGLASFGVTVFVEDNIYSIHVYP